LVTAEQGYHSSRVNRTLSNKVAIGFGALLSVNAALALAFTGKLAWIGIQKDLYLASLSNNVIQWCALACGLAFKNRNPARSSGERRLFWSLVAGGIALWLANQSYWIYYEDILRTEMPDMSAMDIVFFMHVVPLLAAASVQPHAERNKESVRYRLGSFDFAMLLLFWVFLYAFIVFPYQYVRHEFAVYGPHINLLYSVENAVLILSFGALWWTTTRQWRRVYRMLCVGASVYMAASAAVNGAIDRKVYVSGSIYDVPITIGMCLFAYSAVLAVEDEPQQEAPLLTSQQQFYWHSALAGLAMMMMPLMAVWALVNVHPDADVQRFRLYFTLFSMMAMMALFFFKQTLLDRRLIALLQESRRAYEEQQALQGHLLHAEKLAAIGRLVAGAAHEINNPLTAIVGYSDLMAGSEKLDAQHRDFAEKILQQARRTKALVQNLLTFAKQTPLERRAVNINAIVGHALQLHELDFAGKNVQIICRMHADIPAVVGDENQLLQVFLHIMNNGVDAMLEHSGGGSLIVSTDFVNERVQWSCSDTGPGVPDPNRIFDPFFTTKPVGKGTGLGLSASYGIIRDHRGEITCQNRPEGGATFVISLPPSEEPAAQPAPITAAKSVSIQ
jgi:signal transduction histidine kinase